MIDSTSTQKSYRKAFGGSVAQHCPSILPVTADVDAAAGEATVPQERSTRRRRLDGLDRGIADKAQALQENSHWLTQIDASASSMWQKQGSSTDGALRSLSTVPQDRKVQALREDRVGSSGDQNMPDVVPSGLKDTAGKYVNDIQVTELSDQGQMEPGMDSPSVDQVCGEVYGVYSSKNSLHCCTGRPIEKYRR